MPLNVIGKIVFPEWALVHDHIKQFGNFRKTDFLKRVPNRPSLFFESEKVCNMYKNGLKDWAMDEYLANTSSRFESGTTYGLTPEDARSQNNSAFHIASENGHLDVLKWLHETYGLTPEDARSENNYAFKWASQNGHIHITQWLTDTFGIL